MTNIFYSLVMINVSSFVFCGGYSDIGYDEKQVSLIRRIDFGWAVEKEDEEKKQKKRQKKSSRESSSTTTPWPWKNMVENLHLAHQELSVIIDLINTVRVIIISSATHCSSILFLFTL